MTPTTFVLNIWRSNTSFIYTCVNQKKNFRCLFVLMVIHRSTMLCKLKSNHLKLKQCLLIAMVLWFIN